MGYENSTKKELIDIIEGQLNDIIELEAENNELWKLLDDIKESESITFAVLEAAPLDSTRARQLHGGRRRRRLGLGAGDVAALGHAIRRERAGHRLWGWWRLLLLGLHKENVVVLFGLEIKTVAQRRGSGRGGRFRGR